ncbi:MAG: sigma-70 family RNA polymerase sigma factor [Cellulosilyticaceae bacterium]
MENQSVNTMKSMEDIQSEEIQAIQNRTAQLYEIMQLCNEDAEALLLCRNEVIETNIKLVHHVLKKYRPFGDDEFQIGCLGLIGAANTFKPERNVPFSSYACFCIERELHKAHRVRSHSFEYQAGGNLSSLDEMINLGNGDTVSRYESIADSMSEEMFDKILSDFVLTDVFEEIITPAIDGIATRTNGQDTTVDFDVWKKLEMRYLLELAEVDSQKARVTLSAIAKELGVSTQNIRIRHQRVVESIRLRCIECGIEI